jgi:hypothetical protein
MKRLALLFALLATAAVFAGACGTQPGGTQQVGKMQHESKSVDPEGAQSARAQLKIGAGELNLTGGADQLMEADFSYNVSDWKPKVSYDVSGDEGELVVRQGGSEGSDLGGEARNEWEIRLNDDVPTDLVVQMGAGESDLDLDSLTLPSEVGVKAKAQGGLGKINAEGLERVGDSYVNDAYGESDVTLNVDVQGGVGEINLEVV